MRPEPLVDLASLDLTREAVPLEEFRSVVPHRGNFALVHGVVHHDLEGERIVGFTEIRSTDWWARDHVPGRPLFPGALMVEASAQLATYDFMCRRPEVKDQFVGFAGIDGVRFRATVEPDCRLYLVARPTRIRRTIYNYQVQGLVDGEPVFEGAIIGMVI